MDALREEDSRSGRHTAGRKGLHVRIGGFPGGPRPPRGGGSASRRRRASI
jgi:hypothetical protein